MDELNQVQNPNVPSSMPPMMDNGKKRQMLLIIIGIAIVVASLVWYFSATQVGLVPQLPVPTPTPEVEAQLDSQLNAEVENVDLGDLDMEFKEIDNDLNSL